MTMTKRQKTGSAAEGASGIGPAGRAAPETGALAAGPGGADMPGGPARGQLAGTGSGGAPAELRQLSESLSAQGKMIKKNHAMLEDLHKRLNARLPNVTSAREGEEAKSDSGDGPLEKVAQRIEEQVRVYTADFHRWQEVNQRIPAKLRAVFTAVSFASSFFLGVMVEQRWQPIPVHDNTGGWKSYVWKNYGGQVIDCVRGIGNTTADGRCVIAMPGGK